MTSGTAQCGPSASSFRRARRRGGITSDTVRTQLQRSSPASGAPGRREEPSEPRLRSPPTPPGPRAPLPRPGRGRMDNPGSAAYPGTERRRPGGRGGEGAGSWLVLAAERVREPAGRPPFPPVLLFPAGSCRGISRSGAGGQCPVGSFPLAGVALKHQSGEKRAAAPGTAAPPGLGGRESWHCTTENRPGSAGTPFSERSGGFFLRVSVSFQGAGC